MIRLRWMLAIAAMLLCACGERPMPDVFAPVVGDWRRVDLRDFPIDKAPDDIPATKFDRIREAVYEGPGKLTARAYGLVSSAVALDVAQRWQAGADTVFFFSDRFFVVVRYAGADRKAVQAFVAQVAKGLEKK